MKAIESGLVKQRVGKGAAIGPSSHVIKPERPFDKEEYDRIIQEEREAQWLAKKKDAENRKA